MWHDASIFFATSIFCAIQSTEEIEEELNPRGEIHIPISIPNTLDTLKTFIEVEGNFSPGVGSYGIYFWIYDSASDKLMAPTMASVQCDHGLHEAGYLIPWSRWQAGEIEVKTEICEVRQPSSKGDIFVVGARVHLTNLSDTERKVSLYTVIRSLDPAGWAIYQMDVSESETALLVDGHPFPPHAGG